MEINREKNALRNAAWGNIGKLFSLFFPFIFRTVVIYILGAEYAGLNSLFTSVLQMLSLSELGIGSAIVYSMYKPIAENDKNKINSLLNLYRKLYRIIGIVILIIGLLIIPFLRLFINGAYPENINIYYVYIGFLINTVITYLMFGYKTALFNAFQRNDFENKISIITNLLLYGAASVLIVLLKSYYLYLISLICTTILYNITVNFVTKRYFSIYKCEGKTNGEERTVIKKNVMALICHKIGGTVLNSSDNIVISSFLGLSILSNYNNYYYIMSAAESMIFICFTGLIGGLGNSAVTESREKNTEIFEKIFFFNKSVVIIFGTIMFCIYQDFICLWLGNDYLFGLDMVVMFIVYFYIHTIRRTIIVFRDATGFWWDNRFQPIVSAITNLLLNIILVNVIGIYGIIISTVFAMVFIDIPWESKCFCKNKINISCGKYFYQIVINLIILILCCCISGSICKFINFSLIVNIIVKCITAVIISMLVIVLIYRKRSEFQYYKKLIKKYFYKNIST